MADDFDNLAELIRNGYSVDEALNQVPQTVDVPPEGSITASMIDTTTLSPIVQMAREDDGAVATSGTAIMPLNDTIPQNDEGDEYITVTITPESATNLLVIEAQLMLSHTDTNHWMTAALFQDTTADALTAVTNFQTLATGATISNINYQMTADTALATTFKIRAGANISGTTTFNGSNGVGFFNGVMNSYIKVTEILQ